MDVLYPVCAGIDVHRDTLVVTVSRAVERRARSETRTFGAVTEEVRALVAWLDEQAVPIVAMESTGVYWKPVGNAAPWQPPQTLDRQRRAKRVAREPLASEIVSGVDAHPCVQVECVVKAKEEPMT